MRRIYGTTHAWFWSNANIGDGSQKLMYEDQEQIKGSKYDIKIIFHV